MGVVERPGQEHWLWLEDVVEDTDHDCPRVGARAAALPPGAEPPRLLNPTGPAQAGARDLYLLHLGEEASRLVDALGG
jgi:hypothetical protein